MTLLEFVALALFPFVIVSFALWLDERRPAGAEDAPVATHLCWPVGRCAVPTCTAPVAPVVRGIERAREPWVDTSSDEAVVRMIERGEASVISVFADGSRKVKSTKGAYYWLQAK